MTNLSTPTGATPYLIRTWYRAVRVPSFTASVTPVMVGASLALVDGGLTDARGWLLLVAMLVASVAVHAGCNLGNDYYDWKRGIDPAAGSFGERPWDGPGGVIQDGSLTPRQILGGMIAVFVLATVIGLGIVAAAGWPIFVLALGCLALAFLYTGGPKPLGYIALGEVTVFLTMGLAMIMGSYGVLTGTVSWRAFGVALPLGLLVTAILHGNNIADIETDRAAGKVTVANAIGRVGANIEYAALVTGAYVAVIGLVLTNPDLWPVLLVFLSVPRALAAVRLYWIETTRFALRRGVRRSAGLHLQFGLLMAAGLLIAFVIGKVG